jgi:MoxR-like ATPase
MNAREPIFDLKQRMARSIVGQEHIIDRLLVALLANGHLLVESLPGLAKTRAVKSLAKSLEAGFSRIQFTPDLVPSDITGTEVYYQADGRGELRFQQGPVFSNLVLADEINRAPAKVQAALLEAMEERQVTVAGKTHKLPHLFLVMATQSPIEQEGTYPLPETQMDRFLMHVLISYPDEKAEAEIVRLVRGEEEPVPRKEGAPVNAIPGIPQQAVFDARREVHGVQVAPAVEKYMVDLVFATRFPDRYGKDLRRFVQVGASPRGALALDRCSRAHAWLQGRDHVVPDDVRAVAHDCLRHRVTLTYEAAGAAMTADKIVSEIVRMVAVA